MDHSFLYGFLSYERIWRSLFYWVWNVFSVKEGEEKHFNLMEGKHKHIFIIHYEVAILKNRNGFTDSYLSIIFQGKMQDERRREKWLHADCATRQWSGIIFCIQGSGPLSGVPIWPLLLLAWKISQMQVAERMNVECLEDKCDCEANNILSFGKTSEITIFSDLKQGGRGRITMIIV